MRSNKTYVTFFDAVKIQKLNRIYKSIKISNSNNFLVVYGDDLANVNLGKLKESILFLKVKNFSHCF